MMHGRKDIKLHHKCNQVATAIILSDTSKQQTLSLKGAKH